jgi:phage terminase small subunit
VQACRKSNVYKSKTREGATIWKPRPEVAIGNAAKRQYLQVLVELGLTPASSSRCHPLPVEKKRARSGLASYFNEPGPLKPSA